METGEAPFIETEIDDPLALVVDYLTISAPDELIRRVLTDYDDSGKGTVADVRRRLIGLERPQELPTAEALDLIVEIAEKSIGNMKGGEIQPREPGQRIQHCGLTSDFTAVVAEQLGLTADVFQLIRLNEMRGVPAESSLGHALTVLTDRKKNRFLIDLSFCQFIDPVTRRVRQSKKSNLQSGEVSKFAENFIWPGYIPLTDQSLNTYLNLATQSSATAQDISVDTVMEQAKRNDFDHRRSEILNFVDVDFLEQRRLELAKGMTPLRRVQNRYQIKQAAKK